MPKLKGQDFSGKKVAIYGLGNQKSYPNEFIDATYYLYAQFKQCGATLIGDWSTEGYHFKASKAVIENRFVGLALDQENQKELTSERVTAWLNLLAQHWN